MSDEVASSAGWSQLYLDWPGSPPARDMLQAYLDEQQVEYHMHHHSPAYTARQVAGCEHAPRRSVAKVVMINADGSLLMLVVPASRQVDLPLVREMLGAEEVRLAHENEFAQFFPDCEVGAMPPFGNLYDLPVYVDWLLAENEEIAVPAGTHEDTIILRYDDYAALARPLPAHLVHHGKVSPSELEYALF